MRIKIFKYIRELDCFIVDQEYKAIANRLGLTEWNEVVWIGRYLALDNDFGEHWFDNWPEREEIESKAKALGYVTDDLMIIDPDRFKNDQDGPVHSGEERKAFWTDVLDSLHLSLETIVNEAIKQNNDLIKQGQKGIDKLENEIQLLRWDYLTPDE
jgi:hypothetical protein